MVLAATAATATATATATWEASPGVLVPARRQLSSVAGAVARALLSLWSQLSQLSLLLSLLTLLPCLLSLWSLPPLVAQTLVKLAYFVQVKMF